MEEEVIGGKWGRRRILNILQIKGRGTNAVVNEKDCICGQRNLYTDFSELSYVYLE